MIHGDFQAIGEKTASTGIKMKSVILGLVRRHFLIKRKSELFNLSDRLNGKTPVLIVPCWLGNMGLLVDYVNWKPIVPTKNSRKEITSLSSTLAELENQPYDLIHSSLDTFYNELKSDLERGGKEELIKANGNVLNYVSSKKCLEEFVAAKVEQEGTKVLSDNRRFARSIKEFYSTYEDYLETQCLPYDALSVYNHLTLLTAPEVDPNLHSSIELATVYAINHIRRKADEMFSS